MKFGNDSMDKFLHVPTLVTRHDHVIKVAKFVLNHANVPNCCMFTGPQNEIIPKTPAIYIRVGKDPAQFIRGALEAFGIDNEVASKFDSVVTFGDISKESPFLTELNDLSCNLSENHPSTVVTLVTLMQQMVLYLKEVFLFVAFVFIEDVIFRGKQIKYTRIRTKTKNYDIGTI